MTGAAVLDVLDRVSDPREPVGPRAARVARPDARVDDGERDRAPRAVQFVGELDSAGRGADHQHAAPGQLARVSQVISEAGANVVEVLHTRHGQGLVINEVALDLSIEARGPEHAAAVTARLHEAGYRPETLYS